LITARRTIFPGRVDAAAFAARPTAARAALPVFVFAAARTTVRAFETAFRAELLALLTAFRAEFLALLAALPAGLAAFRTACFAAFRRAPLGAAFFFVRFAAGRVGFLRAMAKSFPAFLTDSAK
jgi:hypothetical protein